MRSLRAVGQEQDGCAERQRWADVEVAAVVWSLRPRCGRHAATSICSSREGAGKLVALDVSVGGTFLRKENGGKQREREM